MIPKSVVPGFLEEGSEKLAESPQGQNDFHSNTETLFSFFSVWAFALMVQRWVKVKCP